MIGREPDTSIAIRVFFGAAAVVVVLLVIFWQLI